MVDVILPVLNEAAVLGDLLAAMPPGYRPIVVDNGSDDGSGEIAARSGARVVHEPVPGFGSACWAGLEAAESEVVCFMDADGSLDPRHLPLVALPVIHGAADLMLGCRLIAKGAMPVHARVGNRVVTRAVRRRSGLALSDIGPMRAVGRVGLLDLGMTDRRFGWPLEMVLRAAEAKWRVFEVGIPYAKRKGRSKVTGTLKGTARTVRDMSGLLR